MTLATLEEQVIAEKGAILGFIHNHPIIWGLCTLFAGFIVGKLF